MTNESKMPVIDANTASELLAIVANSKDRITVNFEKE